MQSEQNEKHQNGENGQSTATLRCPRQALKSAAAQMKNGSVIMRGFLRTISK
nr:hypothetical protein [Marinicella sp. W31]MDC2878696.1 hypothetical protein [Marinicella sp. W31]